MHTEPDITLSDIQKYYEFELVPFEFNYELEDGTNINLRFKKEDFCHLVGIHYFAPEDKLKHEYRSHLGYSKIENNEITINTLSSNKGAWGKHKERILNFIHVKEVLVDPKILLFNANVVSGGCNIKCTFVLSKPKNNVVLNLAIDVKTNGKYYYPVTFLVTLGSTKDKFIRGQKQCKILKTEIVELKKADYSS